MSGHGDSAFVTVSIMFVEAYHMELMAGFMGPLSAKWKAGSDVLGAYVDSC